MRSLRSAFALALLAALVPAPAPARVFGFCTAIPLPPASRWPLEGATPPPCMPVTVPAPHGTMHLAVVTTEELREQGLMNVSRIPVDEGMLFVFQDPDGTLNFWMKNTIVPLDMIFIKGDGTISSIAADVPATKPGTPDDQVARRSGFGHFVIELGAGNAARLGLKPGERLAGVPFTTSSR